MPAPASPAFDDLVKKLDELFMFDRADLDFGLYRILNQKRAEVRAFLDTKMRAIADEALGLATEADIRSLEARLADERATAKKYGAPDPDAVEKVREAAAAYASAKDTGSVEALLYTRLRDFFARYYKEGDFIPLRRYSGPGRERYMIPYDGEEVKLVWANMDQYYIKSSEALTDYAFTLPASVSPDAPPPPLAASSKLSPAARKRPITRRRRASGASPWPTSRRTRRSLPATR